LIAVIDFGSQYTQLIARRIRELGVYSEIYSPFVDVRELPLDRIKGFVLSGGPASVYDDNAPVCSSEIFELGKPVLGICYGMQLITRMLGGVVERSDKREYGFALLRVLDKSDIFKGLPDEFQVWMSHGDRILKMPEGFRAIAETENTPVAAFKSDHRKIYGLQFHPEVVHTAYGKEILSNFVKDICGCESDWRMESFIEQSVREIRERVGDEKVLCALSGGVDSSVVTLLVHKAIGDRLIPIFVDNGLLRKNEAKEVLETFESLGVKIHFVDASERFLNRLKGVTDPEKKRKIIGEEFIRVFEEEASKFGKIRFLAQGTLYPDVIESISVWGPSSTIKSHHNVGGLPDRFDFELIEPLRFLFKDEVREIGRLLGLPDRILKRHPFPGPGLAIRVVGEITREKLDILREADAIVVEEIKNAGLYHKLWQAFAVLLSVKSVGVMGDERTYDYVVAVRAVESVDGMTADWSRLPYELLGRISNRIINEVKGVNRVVYDISSKPPSTIEWE